MKKGNALVAVLVILGFLALIGLFFMGSYNSLVRLEEGVTSAWSQVENVYQRRLDLIPNLVETVKGYAGHEKSTLQAVVEARAQVGKMSITSDTLTDPAKFEQFQQSQGALSSSLSRLLVVAEQYPDLKANQNFLQLQAQLEGTENRIAVERGRFNEAAQAFNFIFSMFPTNVFGGLFGFKLKEYFKADATAKTAPKVTF